VGRKRLEEKNDIIKKATESINPHDEPSRLKRKVALRMRSAGSLRRE
jgi:hypothetical protein